MKMHFNYLKASLLFFSCALTSIASFATYYTESGFLYNPPPTEYLSHCNRCPKTDDQLEEQLERRGVEVVEVGNKLAIILGVDRMFMPSSNTRLRYSQVETMQLVALYLKKRGVSWATVYGHTDNVGSDRSKLKRTKLQAETIAAYLWSNGVPLRRIRSVGCGDTEPVASNQTVDGGAANRRIEIITH